jgi:hypothetical protein
MITSNLNIRGIAHVAALLFLLALLSVVANAYTIVFRDGRRLEIPNNFTVSGSTLTYEAASGIQITLQLAAINIAATEQVNGESSGSLIKHTVNTKPQPVQVKSVRPGTTVTNQDLERFRKARIASEVAYEKRRKELGLPSVEESRRAALSSSERDQVDLINRRSREQESETYWRGRASELRTELAATNARISFVQSRLNELPSNYSLGGFTSVSPYPWFGPRPIFGNYGLGGQARLNPFLRPGFRRFPNQAPFGTMVALPFDAYDNSYERTTLVTQLDELLARRAELQARWGALEEEARRAGAYPGWLR